MVKLPSYGEVLEEVKVEVLKLESGWSPEPVEAQATKV